MLISGIRCKRVKHIWGVLTDDILRYYQSFIIEELMEYTEAQKSSRIEEWKGKAWANHHTATPHPVPKESIINSFCALERFPYISVFIISP